MQSPEQKHQNRRNTALRPLSKGVTQPGLTSGNRSAFEDEGAPGSRRGFKKGPKLTESVGARQLSTETMLRPMASQHQVKKALNPEGPGGPATLLRSRNVNT